MGLDHDGYWRNDEGFLVPLIRHIDDPIGDGSGSRFYTSRLARAVRIERRRRRVGLLLGWRWASFAAGVVALVAALLPGITPGVSLATAGNGVATAWSNIPGHELVTRLHRRVRRNDRARARLDRPARDQCLAREPRPRVARSARAHLRSVRHLLAGRRQLEVRGRRRAGHHPAGGLRAGRPGVGSLRGGAPDRRARRAGHRRVRTGRRGPRGLARRASRWLASSSARAEPSDGDRLPVFAEDLAQDAALLAEGHVRRRTAEEMRHQVRLARLGARGRVTQPV